MSTDEEASGESTEGASGSESIVSQRMTRRQAISTLGKAAIAAGVVVVAGGTSAYYFSQQAEPTGPVKITAALWSGFPLVKGTREITIPAFQEANPRITVELLPLDRFEMLSKYLTEFTAGTGSFDVVSILPSWIGTFERNLLPLDDFIGADAAFNKNDFIPNIWDRYAIWKGKTLAVPVHPDPQVLLYRTDLFNDEANKREFKKQFGYDLVPPRTLPQVLDAAKFFHNAHGSEFGIVDQYTARGLGFTYQSIFSSFRRQADATATLGPVNPLFLEFFTSEGKPAINTEVGRKAAQFLVELVKYTAQPVSSLSLDEAVKLFSSGRTAMLWGWVFILPTVRDPKTSKVIDKFGVLPPPGGAPYLGGFSLAVNKDSKHPREAAKYVLFATNAANQRQAFEKFGLSPSRNSTFDALRPTGNPLLDVLREIHNTGSPRPRIAGSEQIIEIMSVVLEKMVNRELSVSDAVKQIQERWESALAK